MDKHRLNRYSNTMYPNNFLRAGVISNYVPRKMFMWQS